MPNKLVSLLREIAMLFWLAAVLFVSVSLITYSPSDPGPTHSGSGDGIINSGGLVGAWLSDLLFNIFGYSAYGFLILAIGIGYNWYRNSKSQELDGVVMIFSILGLMAAMFGLCALEYLYLPPPSESVGIFRGGILGQLVAAVVLENFGEVGGVIVLLTLFFTGLTLTTSLSWLALMDVIGFTVFRVFGWLREYSDSRVDRQIGTKVREKRRESIRQFRDEMEARVPPQISERVTPTKTEPQFKQMNLLSSDGFGEVPSLELLDPPADTSAGYSNEELSSMSELLVKKLQDFGVEISVEAVQPGPVITRFEVEPAPGVKSSRIVGLARDLARSLSVESVRVVDNIAGKTVVGIEIPNQSREIVKLVEGLSSPQYKNSNSPLSLVLGKDIAGHPVITDLMKMPHVLIAGTTGSGKSVCVNALILSILYKSTESQVRMIMVDPKFLELSVYEGIPHLLAPVVTDMNKAANALRWCIIEMDRRFRLMAAVSVRNIAGFNKAVTAANKSGQPMKNPLSETPEDAEELQKLPFIVVIVDELADLMMVVGKKIEEIIIRIAQRARAAGIHLILATQRPSVDVVTGLIKANVPTRIAFQVSSRADSRTVLDQMGAEQLLGQGDMLFMPPGSGFTQRVHGSFVSDEEVAKVVAELKTDKPPVYINEITESDSATGDIGSEVSEDSENDPIYDQAVQFVCENNRASISALQRNFRVGYNRAARLIEMMETAGIVSAAVNGKREIITPLTAE